MQENFYCSVWIYEGGKNIVLQFKKEDLKRNRYSERKNGKKKIIGVYKANGYRK